MGYAYEYRPVTLTSFAIESQFFGDDPHVSHFINVLLYGFTAVLLFAVLYYIFREYRYNFLLPLTATLLFIVHPIHTEVVASIKNRDELLCLLGGLGGLYFAIRYIDQKTLALWASFLFCFILGLLSKRSIIPFALIIPFAATLFRQPGSLNILALSAPLAVIIPFFTPVYLLFDKIIIGLLLIVMPLSFQVFIHERTWLFQLIQKWLNRTKDFLKSVGQKIKERFRRSQQVPSPSESRRPSEQVSSGDIKTQSPKNKVDQVDWPHHLLWGIMGGISFLMALTGFLSNNQFFTYGGILLLFGVVFMADIPLRSWLIVVLAIILSLQAWLSDHIMYINLLYLFIIGESLQYQNRFSPVILVALLFPAIVDIGIMEGWLSIIKIVVMGALVTSVKKLPNSLLSPFVIALFISGCIVLFISQWTFALPIFFLTGYGCYTIWSSKLMPRLADILFLLSIGVLLPFYESTWINQNNLPVAQQAEEFELQNQPAPQALPSDYRELEYVENPIPHLDNPAQKLSISFYALGTYFQKLTIPHPLNYYYGYRKIPVVSISHPFVIGSIIVYLALAILTVYFFFRDRKILAFGIGVFLVSILPFSNLISPVAGMVGERLAYVASLGFCIALAYVLLWLFQVDLKRAKPSFAKLPKGFVILVGLLLLSGSFKTIQRNNQWEDSLTLFRNDIRHLRESAQAHNLLASHLVQEANKIQQRREQRKMRQEAIQHFREAVEIHPEFFNPIYDLGRTHLLVGNQQKAKKAFKRAIEVNPDFPNSYLKLANMFYENEDFDKAIPYYQEVIELLPNKVGAFTNLSFIYFRKGEYQKSIEVNQKALHNNPQAVNPRINLGKTYMRMNNNQNAIRYFEEAFELQPNNLNVAKSLAQLHQEQGNNRKANYYKRQARNLSQQGRR